MIKADLHVHTYYSDGLLSPAEVVSAAKANGVEMLAVTDHDCMLGCLEASQLGKICGVKALNGIEISAYENGVKIHILGYGADAKNPAFAKFLRGLYDGSLERAEDIIRKLNSNGVHITLNDALEFRQTEEAPVHTMHIARACAGKGYAGNPYTFYANYLAPGKCAFSCACRPSPESAVQAVIAGGGKSSIAHPGRIELSPAALDGLVKKLKDCGLYGIEAVYTTHTVTETAYYKEMATTYGLVVTGGSDTHFSGGKTRIGAPPFFLDEAVAKQLES